MNGPHIDAKRIIDVLSISRRTLLRWVKAGKFPGPAFRVGTTLRWNPDDVAKALNVEPGIFRV